MLSGDVGRGWRAALGLDRVGGGLARCRMRAPVTTTTLSVERCHVQNDRKCSTVQSSRYDVQCRKEVVRAHDRHLRSGPDPDRHPRAHPRRRRRSRPPVRAAARLDGRGRRVGSGVAGQRLPLLPRSRHAWSPPCCGAPPSASSRAAQPRCAAVAPWPAQVAEAAVFIREHISDESLTLPALGADDALLATLLAAHVDGLVVRMGRVLAAAARRGRRARRDPGRPRPPTRSPSGSSGSCCRLR